MENVLILAIALVLDLLAGEPPRAIHPVVWMGKVIAFFERWGAGWKPGALFAYGMAVSLFTIALFAVPAYFLMAYLNNLSSVAYVVVGALLIKSAFSLKELVQAAHKIKTLLLGNKLEKARFELRALCGRNAADLPQPLIVSGAVESVAENISDSFVAPLFYFLFLGVPGAIAYRAANTLDAMIGHHGKYEYLGKFAARLDTALNFIPARLSALLIVLAAFLARHNGRQSWQTAIEHHSRTASPNAGWPMSAMAGALDVQLEKVGHYRLGNGAAPLVPEMIDHSTNLIWITASFWAALCLSVEVIRVAY
jgi:adenosylcobinamide-phosphate synthase